MKSFVCIILVVLAAASHQHGPGLRVRNAIEVNPVPADYQSSLPPVHGARSCGGLGKFRTFRMEGCAQDSTCRIPGDGEARQTELEFVPSEDADALGIRLNLLTDGTAETVYERAVSDSAVQGDQTYVVSAKGSATEEFKGKTVTIQYILYRVDDNNVEVCVEADFEVY